MKKTTITNYNTNYWYPPKQSGYSIIACSTSITAVYATTVCNMATGSVDTVFFNKVPGNVSFVAYCLYGRTSKITNY